MVEFDGIEDKDCIWEKLMKDDLRIVSAIMETPSGEFLLHLDGGVGKWGTPPKMGGKPCSMRECSWEGRLTMMEN